MKITSTISKVLILAFLLLNPVIASGQFYYMENENVGKEVQDFSLKVVGGEETNLKKFRGESKAIVFFWATWCPHCRVQLGELSTNKEKLAKDNIKIVLVDVGEEEPVVDKYLKKTGIEIDVFLDIDSKVSEQYGLVGVPTFYFVDEKGIVRDVQHSLPEDINSVFSET